jgi:hypothetical protein
MQPISHCGLLHLPDIGVTPTPLPQKNLWFQAITTHSWDLLRLNRMLAQTRHAATANSVTLESK